MRKLFFASGTALAITCIAMFGPLSKADSQTDQSNAVKLPESFPAAIAEAISKSEYVESFRVDPSLENQKDNALGVIGGHDVLEVGPKLTKEQADQAVKLLLDPLGYRPKALGKMCLFVPRHALRFAVPQSPPIEVVICFECNQLSLGNGIEGWWGDFDPISWRLESRSVESIHSLEIGRVEFADSPG